jgi:pseudaminic acid cytidylyltransferase
MNKIAIIPARGGSKRIPRKNIKKFLGKPIIAYSIEAAKASNLFDTVMVSTDDNEIMEIATQYGAEVPFLRSAQNSDDYATTSDVLIEVLQNYDRKIKFDIVCCIYPTAPFVTSDMLLESYELFHTSKSDSLVPIVKYSYPPQRAFLEQKGYLKYREPMHTKSRSQDLESIYHDAGQFYWTYAETINKFQSLIGEFPIPYKINEMHVHDIDDKTDFKIAEQKFRLINQSSS